ncbi:hypothetical protein [Caballeronia sp. NCTM5]|uniref:hypothetical protein n=1 Tax=Caballeronia sp. NCTM5 TaxID=2921755 RepID=UPI00202942CA|nr:hypothetical protein [Caballeronia sp. NCTM5]
MKLMFAPCMKCLQETDMPLLTHASAHFYEERVAFFECPAGHKNALVLQAQKFEVLMESGAYALDAGFTLEACASFSTALERFYEFAMKVLMLKLKVSESVYERMFKEMARQSERQVGALMALYAIEFGGPLKLDNNIVSFRNAVIHKGTIPDQADAEKFCSDVYAIISGMTKQLRERLGDAVEQAVSLDMAKRHSVIPDGVHSGTSAGGAFFSLAAKDIPATFGEAIRSLKMSIEYAGARS